jgi:hypothetical protein
MLRACNKNWVIWEQVARSGVANRRRKGQEQDRLQRPRFIAGGCRAEGSAQCFFDGLSEPGVPKGF